MKKEIELILRMPVMLIIWALQILIKTPVAILGLFLNPIMYYYRNTPYKDIPWYLIWLTNPEDQYGGYPGYPDSLPPFWHRKKEAENWSLRYAHWFYMSIRNPADGLRNFKILQAPLEAEKIKFITNQYLRHYEPRAMEPGKWYFYFCWTGFYLGVKLNRVWRPKTQEKHGRYFEFKWGFRIHPADALGLFDPKGTRAILGASMATKFLPYRKY